MQAIYNIINTYNNRIVGVRYTYDLEATIEGYKNGTFTDCRRYKYRDTLDIDVVETGESVCLNYYKYIWPQSDRIVYDQSCINHCCNPGARKRMNKILDFLIEIFTEKKYSFRMSQEEMTITAEVFEDGRLIEIFRFERKEAVSRSFV